MSSETFESLGSYQAKALKIVNEHIQVSRDKSDEEVPYKIYVVWFSKTLQNWKALVSTTLPDGRYYEVTHNGDACETYLDVYVKVLNQAIPD
jgi:hypothetical protein